MQKDLMGAEELFISMHDTSILDDDAYYKCMLGLASEYANRLDIEKALILVHKCPPSYLNGAMYRQMCEDSMFAGAMVELVYRLDQLSFVGDDRLPNMPPAEA